MCCWYLIMYVFMFLSVLFGCSLQRYCHLLWCILWGTFSPIWVLERWLSHSLTPLKLWSLSFLSSFLLCSLERLECYFFSSSFYLYLVYSKFNDHWYQTRKVFNCLVLSDTSYWMCVRCWMPTNVLTFNHFHFFKIINGVHVSISYLVSILVLHRF